MTRTRKSEHLSIDSPIFDGLRAYLAAEQQTEAQARKAAKLEALIAANSGATPGERAAAQAALDRISR